MTDDENEVHVIEVTRRTGAASENGCIHAVKYLVDGEPGERLEWLDEFLQEEFDRPVKWRPGADRVDYVEEVGDA